MENFSQITQLKNSIMFQTKKIHRSQSSSFGSGDSRLRGNDRERCGNDRGGRTKKILSMLTLGIYILSLMFTHTGIINTAKSAKNKHQKGYLSLH